MKDGKRFPSTAGIPLLTKRAMKLGMLKIKRERRKPDCDS
jgi:hypothetical protein